MQLMARANYTQMKIAMTVWGVISALQGASLGILSSDSAPYAHWATTFIYLVYYSVLVAALLSFASTRAASAVLCLITIVALGILFFTRPFDDGLGLGASLTSLMRAIALRPALACLVFVVVYRSERRLPM